MKKNNGFTLIELLATIIILAAIALVAFPILLNTIKNSEGKIDKTTEKLVLNAAKLYVDENLNDYIKSEKNTYCIPINSLVESGKLNKGFVDSNKNITLDYMVELKYNKEKDKFLYDVSKECQKTYFCNLVNDENGDKKFDVGDEIACGTENFYVIQDDGDSIQMLSKYNVDLVDNIQSGEAEGVCSFSNEAYWYDNGIYFNIYKQESETNYYVFDKKQTSESTYVNACGQKSVIDYVVAYEKKLKEIGIVTATAKLMSYSQAVSLGCGTLDGAITCEFKNGTNREGGCCQGPEWVYSVSYWLGSSRVVNKTNRIWTIDNNGANPHDFDLPPYQTNDKFHGVRPVVTISKNEININ